MGQHLFHESSYFFPAVQRESSWGLFDRAVAPDVNRMAALVRLVLSPPLSAKEPRNSNRSDRTALAWVESNPSREPSKRLCNGGENKHSFLSTERSIDLTFGGDQ